MDVPTTCFRGYVRQVNLGMLDDIGRMALDLAFPAFAVDAAAIVKMAEDLAARYPIDLVYAQTKNHRRYAGDEELGRGRYFSLCSEHGKDEGTLKRELLAYVDFKYTSGFVEVIDDEQNLQRLRELYAGILRPNEFAVSFGLQAADPLVTALRVRSVHGRGCVFEGQLDSGAARIAVVPIAPSVQEQVVEEVLDLRLPEHQDWLFDMFVRRNALNIDFFPSNSAEVPATSFYEMLPVLLDYHLGGNALTSGIGGWLQRHNVRGLIYPSARTDVGVRFEEGKLIDCLGWCFVDFRDFRIESSEPRPSRFTLASGGWSKKAWTKLTVEIPTGRYSGSFQGVGIEEWHAERLRSRVPLPKAEAHIAHNAWSGLGRDI